MKVNLNNLRLRGIESYKIIVNTLNEGTNNCGVITIDADEIADEMDDLRQILIALACVFNKDDELFRDLTDEIGVVPEFYPAEENNETL